MRCVTTPKYDQEYDRTSVAPVPVTNLQLFTSKNIELEAYVGLDACLEIDHHLFG